jgi:DNA polymerase-3 subunit gamma/tau
MTQALYRKWRPRSWDEVVGQDHIIQTLRNAVAGERVAHAYLFAGPRGTGKTTTARLLAKAVNCLHDSLTERPCNACDHCKAVNEGRFLDLIEIDAASNTSVEDVRDLRDKINFSPNEGRYKVYIIDEVHMLSTAAFNAILKTLEEPPGHAIFVLATTEVHKIPATVLSRCQRHEFRRLPVATIVEYLLPMVEREGLEVDREALEIIARQATGSLRDAISLVDQLASTGQRVTLDLAQEVLGTAASEAVRGVVNALIDQDASRGLTLINQALDCGTDPRQFARQVVSYLRGLLLVRMDNADLVDAPLDTREEMTGQVDKIALPALLRAIQAFGQAAGERRLHWHSALPLELAFVEAMGRTDVEPASSTPSSSEKPQVEEAPERVQQPKAETSSPPPTRTAKAQGDVLRFRDMMNAWSEVLSTVRRYDVRAQALLNSCRPLDLESGALIIGFSSDLLREKMEKRHNMSTAKTALQEVFGVAIGLRCILTDSWTGGKTTSDELPPMEDGGMVSTALRDLGGQVVTVERTPREGGQDM